jgi:hypothetical protein
VTGRWLPSKLACTGSEIRPKRGISSTGRSDVAETELQDALDLQDEVLEAVAPALEERERRTRAAVHEAIRSLEGDPTASWDAKHRRWMPVAVKVRLIAKFGGRRFLELFPW